ncbi:MAG TPA: TlpA disulfide reductase family protein [Puia sp.]|jgi:thiol-disulfide isomerase/thioredoxin|nr:TlpA disulfide reductase family protein [Puia sp.]
MTKFILKVLTVFVILSSGISKVTAYSYQVPEIGKPCPDFKFNNLINSNQKQISLKDFKGKWLMIDFWESQCTLCIQRFPKMNRLQQIFKNDLTVLMVGYNEMQYNRNIRKFYSKLQDKMHLQLLAAFDSVLFKRWQVPSFPNIIIVNPAGLVYAITEGLDMDSAKIRDLLDGKNPGFTSNLYTWEFDRKKPMFINNNGGPDTGYCYRSMLAPYRIEEQYAGNVTDFHSYYERNKAGFQVLGSTLSELYHYAYIGKVTWGLFKDSLFGKVSPNLELHIKDSSLFQPDAITGKNYFNYSLFVPPGKANPVYLMQVMQRELKNCFGYEVTIEERDVPYWSLVLRKDTLVSLRSIGSIKKDSSSAVEIQIKNGSLEEVLLMIACYQNGETAFIDDTGIDYPVDIQLNALLKDLSDVQQAFRKIGLDLIKSKKQMKVIVIRDHVQN